MTHTTSARSPQRYRPLLSAQSCWQRIKGAGFTPGINRFLACGWWAYPHVLDWAPPS
jgi:hypothetical protein